MDLDDIKKRFVEEVKLRAYDDKYVDRSEEREILQIALQQGISVDSARSALANVCEKENYILESTILREVGDMLEIQAGNDGKIDEKEYKDAVSLCQKKTAGKRSDVQCKRMVLEIIDEKAYATKAGMFSNWYKRAKKEVGMA